MNLFRRPQKMEVVAFAAGLILASGISSPAFAKKDPSAATKTPIKHVVIVFGENMSFDHYFATYPVAQNTELPHVQGQRRYTRGQWS